MTHNNSCAIPPRPEVRGIPRILMMDGRWFTYNEDDVLVPLESQLGRDA